MSYKGLTCFPDHEWSDFEHRCVPKRDHQMDPVEAGLGKTDIHYIPSAEELYRHQPDPAEQTAQYTMRHFASGATRDTAENKPDYKGYLSPLALRHFGRYMLKHQKQADGTMRASDNWKKGIPLDAYAQSLIRHVMEFWLAYEAAVSAASTGTQNAQWDVAEDALDAILFNTSGILHEREKLK